MKAYFFISILFLGFFSPDLSKVREDYKNAFNNKDVTLQLNENLAAVKKTDNKVLVAYKGAVLALMAKHSKNTKDKKSFFKEGATLIDFAILEQPTNVEMRCIRLGVQENTPKLLKYRANKSEDKQLIIDHFDTINSKDIKKYVRGFIMQSKSFSEEEKIKFK